MQDFLTQTQNQAQAITRTNKDFWFACVDIKVIRDKQLSQTAKFIFTLLCSFINLNNRSCWPCNETVAEMAGLSVSTVKRAYNELLNHGVISRSERYNENGQKSSFTIIIGHNAKCYEENAANGSVICGRVMGELPPSSPVNHEINKVNDINYSKEGKAPNPENKIKEVPEIMQTTARYLLQRTGRNTLTDGEISALKELAKTQTPARVQKEIERAYARFVKNGRDLKTLYFEYIASSLAHQPTFGENSKKNKLEKEKIKKETQEFKSMEIQNTQISDEEFNFLMSEIRGRSSGASQGYQISTETRKNDFSIVQTRKIQNSALQRPYLPSYNFGGVMR